MNEEKTFWNEVLDLWEPPSDKYEERLLAKIRFRLQKIETVGINLPGISMQEDQGNAMMRRRGK